MKYSAKLTLDSRANIPFFAFTLVGEFDGGEATVTVLRSPDNVARIGISRLDEDLFKRSYCKRDQWVFSVQATDDDCNFLLRLPERTPVLLTWDDSGIRDNDGDPNHSVGKRASFSLQREPDNECRPGLDAR